MLKAPFFALIPIALGGCGAPSAAGLSFPQAQNVANLKRPPPLCIKLTDGDPIPERARCVPADHIVTK
jgi:hypothetical protein